MHSPWKSILVVGGAAVVVIAGTIHATASWTLKASTTVQRIETASLPRGLTPDVAREGSAAVVSWEQQRASNGEAMTGYLVIAHSRSTPPQPALRREVDAGKARDRRVTFAAKDVAGGSWVWTITPKFHAWAGAESEPSAELTFPALKAPTTAATRADTAESTNTTSPTPTTTSTSEANLVTKPAESAEAGEATKDPEPAAGPDDPIVAAEPPSVRPSPADSSSSIAAPNDEAADK